MKKKPASRSAFLNPRVLIGFAFCATGVFVALLAFGLYPGGKALAREKQSNVQGLAQQNVVASAREPLSVQAVSAIAVEEEIDMAALPGDALAPQAIKPPSPDVPAAVFVVNTTADTQDVTPGDGICADSGGMCSLRAAITEANFSAVTADTITLPAGTYTTTLVAANEDLNAGGDFDIRGPLTINGAGAGTTIIQAAAAPGTATERVMQVTTGATTVGINDVTIRNGNSTVSTAGGGIRVDVAAAAVTLTNVVLTANRVALAGNVFGGGAFVSLGSLTLQGCTVSNNSATATTTAFNGFAGGIYNQQGTLNVTNSTVTGNTASSFHGGIRTLSSTVAVATTNITNSTVSNNVAQGLNPTASGGPGEGGGVTNIAASTFASTTTVNSSTVSGNSALATGSAAGGVENFSVSTGVGVVNLTNSTVSGNTAEVAGGIYSDGAVATINLDYSTVAANSATGATPNGVGGGLLQDVTAGGLTNLKDSIVGDNTAAVAGPDISGTITSQNYNHVENTAGGVFAVMPNDVTGSDAGLSPLQNNGGPTFTHMPSAVSPVLNTIPNGTAGCGTTVLLDQRGPGHPRPTGGACEKGSVERQPDDATPTPTPFGTPTPSPTPTATATATPTATSTPTIPPTPTPTPSPGCGLLLYDQTDNPGTNATSSQDFEAVNDAFDDETADDFVVPAGNTWTIQQVVVNGVYFNGTGPAASFDVRFYSDTATLPGALVSAQLNAPYTNVAGVFTIYLPASVALTAGTYWVSVQANMDFTPGGQWGWTDRTVTSNSAAAWQNPGGGFAVPACLTWGRRGATCAIDPAAPDQIFKIIGCLSTPTVSISGTVTYCSNPALPPVAGVTMTLTGGASTSTPTDGSGNYTFSSLTPGLNYTVTPTKAARAPGSAGINTVDVIAIQRHFLVIGTPLSGCRLVAANVNGDGSINTVDVIAVQRFFLGLTTGIANTGKYQFAPVNRSYTPLNSNQTAQNYDTIIFGDVTGFISPPRPGGPPPDSVEVPSTVAAVALPEVAADQSKNNFSAAVKTSDIDAQNKLVGFQGDFTFDERVVTFQNPPVSNAGLTGGNWNVSGNVLAGTGPIRTLRISAYSNDFSPLSGSGVLFNLNMTRVSQAAQSTPLIWAAPPDQFIFIDADLNTQTAGNAAPGSVTTRPSQR